MARKPENTFIGSVHAHLPVDLYRLKTHNPYVSGPADVWYSGKIADLWIEYKYLPHIPKSFEIKVNTSPLQEEWLRARHTEGRNVHVILGTKLGGILFSGCAWENTYDHEYLKSLIQTREALADWITLTTTGLHANTQTAPKRRQRHQRLI